MIAETVSRQDVNVFSEGARTITPIELLRHAHEADGLDLATAPLSLAMIDEPDGKYFFAKLDRPLQGEDLFKFVNEIAPKKSSRRGVRSDWQLIFDNKDRFGRHVEILDMGLQFVEFLQSLDIYLSAMESSPAKDVVIEQIRNNPRVVFTEEELNLSSNGFLQEMLNGGRKKFPALLKDQFAEFMGSDMGVKSFIQRSQRKLFERVIAEKQYNDRFNNYWALPYSLKKSIMSRFVTDCTTNLDIDELKQRMDAYVVDGMTFYSCDSDSKITGGSSDHIDVSTPKVEYKMNLHKKRGRIVERSISTTSASTIPMLLWKVGEDGERTIITSLEELGNHSDVDIKNADLLTGLLMLPYFEPNIRKDKDGEDWPEERGYTKESEQKNVVSGAQIPVLVLASKEPIARNCQFMPLVEKYLEESIVS